MPLGRSVKTQPQVEFTAVSEWRAEKCGCSWATELSRVQQNLSTLGQPPFVQSFCVSGSAKMELKLKLKVALVFCAAMNCLLLCAAQGGAGGGSNGGAGGWGGGGWGGEPGGHGGRGGDFGYGQPGAPGAPGGYPGAPGAPGGYPGAPGSTYYDQRYRSAANLHFGHMQCLWLLLPAVALLLKFR